MKFSKIHIYNRHFSRNRINPDRPSWYNQEKVFANLLATINFDICDLTIIFEKEEDYNDYFIKKYEGIRPFKVKFIKTDKELWLNKTSEDFAWSRSIAAAAEIINNDKLSEDSLIYITDDDFLHVPNWSEIVLDYFNNYLDNNSCVCPCDYGDKYYFIDDKHTIDNWGTDLGMYSELTSKIRLSSYTHWRQVPNCLTSMCIPVKIFNRDFNDFWSKGYSDGSYCHEVGKKYGTKFWSPIKSLSCHTVNPFIPPFIDWEYVMNNFSIYKKD